MRWTSTKYCSHSLAASKRPPIGGGRVGARLVARRYLNFRLISLLLFLNVDAIYCTHWILIGYEHGCQLVPMDIEVAGYMKFLWVWIWADGGCIVPTHTLAIPSLDVVAFCMFVLGLVVFIQPFVSTAWGCIFYFIYLLFCCKCDSL